MTLGSVVLGELPALVLSGPGLSHAIRPLKWFWLFEGLWLPVEVEHLFCFNLCLLHPGSPVAGSAVPWMCVA